MVRGAGWHGVGVARGRACLAGLNSDRRGSGRQVAPDGRRLVTLRGLLTPGKLTPGPAAVTVLSRGSYLAFFGADTYVPLAITSVRGQSTVVASVAVTAATLAWTAGSWVQERKAAEWPGRRLIRAGFLIVAAGIACEAAALSPAVPVAVGVAGWAVGGFGIGLAYSPISLLVPARPPAAGGGRPPRSSCRGPRGGHGGGLGGVLVAAGADAVARGAGNRRRLA